uniref:Uncharacterized protein n=1 Tax=Trieres chinensis TaxID=1514140 RepID=A0A7S1ZRH9_TRICV
MDFNEGMRAVWNAVQGRNGNGNGNENDNKVPAPSHQYRPAGATEAALRAAGAVGAPGTGFGMSGLVGNSSLGAMGNLAPLNTQLYGSPYAANLMSMGATTASNMGGLSHPEMMLGAASRRRMMSSIMTGVGMAAQQAAVAQCGGSLGGMGMGMGMAGFRSPQSRIGADGTIGVGPSLMRGIPGSSMQSSSPNQQIVGNPTGQIGSPQYMSQQGADLSHGMSSGGKGRGTNHQQHHNLHQK